MSDLNKNSLHKEFELERMVLFSDAVFAIAITLLVIEIRFPDLPENYKEHLDLGHMFSHTIIEFLGFILSFFFIGMSWAKHLKLFKYLGRYDNKVIAWNLISLFFIVAFPFSASGITHFRPDFMLPIIIYIGNVLFIFLSTFILADYIFKRQPSLSTPGFAAEKKYIYMQNLLLTITLGTCFCIILCTFVITGSGEATQYSLYSVMLIPVTMRTWLRKYKPKKTAALPED